jgi:hypothetical protein
MDTGHQSKTSSSKKWTCKKRDFAAEIICLRPSPLLRFCLGWSSNFDTLSACTVYSLLFDREGGRGRFEPDRRLEGQQITKLGEK